MSTATKATPIKYPLVKLKDKAKIIVSKELLADMNYLHREVGKKEWSGVLIHKRVEGELKDPKSLVIRAEALYLSDIGSSAATSYDMSDHIIDLHEKFPQLEEKEYGMGVLH